VGSGPNGLAAAITLAEAGRSVLVLEASSELGGSCRSGELTLPGFTHDVCASVHPLAAVSPFFAHLPLRELGVEFVQPPVCAAHPLDDGQAGALLPSLDATAQRLGSDAAVYRQTVTPLIHLAQAMLELPANPAALTPDLARFMWTVGARSARTLAARLSTEPGRALLAGCAAHAVLPLERAPTGAFAVLFAALAHVRGWPVVAGGSGALIRALVTHLQTLGGELVTDRRVRSLADLPPHRVALFDVSPRQLASIAGGELSARYRRALLAYRYGPGVFAVAWALSGPVPWTAPEARQAGTVHVGGTFAQIGAAEASVAAGRVPEHPFCLITQPGVVDAGRAPAGAHTLSGYCHVPAGCQVDMTAAIEAQIERFAPGFTDLVLARQVRGPRELAAENPNHIGGDIAGGAMTLRQLLARPVARPIPYATSHPGIYLCSSSTPPGPGVHGLSGYLAARAALAGPLSYASHGNGGTGSGRSGGSPTTR
jgi:phytoene dehydrogenase-like protein